MPEVSLRRARPVSALATAAAAAAVAGLLGAWLGLALLANTTVLLGPFRVELDAGFGIGQTRLGLPPFGDITADTHWSPVALSATLRDVGVEQLTEIVGDRGIDELVEVVERDVRDRMRGLGVRALLAGAAGAGILGLLLFRRRWRLVLTSIASGLVGVALCELLLLVTFDPSAFAEPTYSGSLELAPELIGPVNEATDRIDDLRSGLEQIVDGTAGPIRR